MRISNLLIEVLPLQDEEVLPRFDDATLGGDGPGRVDIVPGHHAHCDPRPLALTNSFRHLVAYWILRTSEFDLSNRSGSGSDSKTRQITNIT